MRSRREKVADKNVNVEFSKHCNDTALGVKEGVALGVVDGEVVG